MGRRPKGNYNPRYTHHINVYIPEQAKRFLDQWKERGHTYTDTINAALALMMTFSYEKFKDSVNESTGNNIIKFPVPSEAELRILGTKKRRIQ